MRLTMLFDYYGKLLTEKQQTIMQLYFFHDFSLAEIAEKLSISRQGVYDHLQRAEGVLNDYEKILQISARNNKLKKRLDSLAENIEEFVATHQEKELLLAEIEKIKKLI